MVGIIRRAWADALSSLGIPQRRRKRTALWGILGIAPIGLVYHFRGSPEAMTEAWDIAYYVAPLGAMLALLFLWHLWLAPYRILNEKVEALGAQKGEDQAPSPPAHVDVSKWAGTPIYQLGEASCLWVEVEPHYPLANVDAKATFARLSGATIAGQLECSKLPMRELNAALGGYMASPKYSDRVSAVALKRYAQRLGDVPAFLESVEVPPDDGLTTATSPADTPCPGRP